MKPLAVLALLAFLLASCPGPVAPGWEPPSEDAVRSLRQKPGTLVTIPLLGGWDQPAQGTYRKAELGIFPREGSGSDPRLTVAVHFSGRARWGCAVPLLGEHSTPELLTYEGKALLHFADPLELPDAFEVTLTFSSWDEATGERSSPETPPGFLPEIRIETRRSGGD